MGDTNKTPDSKDQINPLNTVEATQSPWSETQTEILDLRAEIVNRPGVAWVVLQTPPSLID